MYLTGPEHRAKRKRRLFANNNALLSGIDQLVCVVVLPPIGTLTGCLILTPYRQAINELFIISRTEPA